MIQQGILAIHLQVIGGLLIALSLLHIVFPKYFNWKDELAGLSIINKQIMMIHTLFIAIAVLLIGVLCLHSPEELITTDLGRTISFGLGLFWLVRLLVQFFGYSSKLWKGKSFETAVHLVFSAFWSYLTIIFLTVSLLT